MIAGFSSAKTTSAHKSVTGSTFVRPEHGHRRHDWEALSGGGRRKSRQRGRDNSGGIDRDPPSLGTPNPLPHPPEPDAKPAPDDPGLIMVRHLAGDDKSDEALGRLLDDLDGLNAPPVPKPKKRETVRPIAPFLTSKDIDSPFYRAASAYEWVQMQLASRNPFRPGAVYSERF